MQFLIDNGGVFEPFSDQHAFAARVDKLEQIYRPEAFQELVRVYRVKSLNKRDVIHRHRSRIRLRDKRTNTRTEDFPSE